MFLSVVLGLLFILGVGTWYVIIYLEKPNKDTSGDISEFIRKEEEHKERSGTLRGKLDHIIPFWLRKRN